MSDHDDIDDGIDDSSTRLIGPCDVRVEVARDDGLVALHLIGYGRIVLRKFDALVLIRELVKCVINIEETENSKCTDIHIDA